MPSRQHGVENRDHHDLNVPVQAGKCTEGHQIQSEVAWCGFEDTDPAMPERKFKTGDRVRFHGLAPLIAAVYQLHVAAGYVESISRLDFQVGAKSAGDNGKDGTVAGFSDAKGRYEVKDPAQIAEHLQNTDRVFD